MVQVPTQVPTQPLTLAVFLELPDTKPASEYIDGEMIPKPMPQGEHSTLQGDLVSVVNGALKSSKVGRAYPELRCTFGDRSMIPDVSVFRWERIPRREDGRVANAFLLHPDWTIEILSPQQRQTQVVRNILHCIDHGTEMGWLLDAEEACIFVYGGDRSVRVFDTVDAVLPVPAFAEVVQLTLGEVFGWLKN
ncbi:MAG: Uma2 family endonuclease [Synechococcales cyanobacterium RU_4_20]|nr:Uma2 family endonuclease [Synechococcales cyanobacterium RU_4_20]NJR67852.1 Uma2 family endonuclease [Synechococcales cyanobacterium CRU_2_2]